jgi:hypothetical protein
MLNKAGISSSSTVTSTFLLFVFKFLFPFVSFDFGIAGRACADALGHTLLGARAEGVPDTLIY